MTSPTASSGWSYSRAGVDRGAIAGALGALLSAARPAHPPKYGRPVLLPGHYAGLVAVGKETLALTTDTVGTKVLLAAEVHRWREVGEDLVAINVNDLAAVGARPIGFVDSISCPAPDRTVFREVGHGLRRGLALAGCALLGGETAVVPSIVRGVDLGGTALGHFPPGRTPVTGSQIRAGDVILGLASSGFHANGYTLIRRLLEERRVNLNRPRPGGRAPIGVELLRPTRTYIRPVEAIAAIPGVRGLAHVSGGGVRNLLRLKAGVRFELSDWPKIGERERWLASLGDVSVPEMFQTFNMGIGFAVVAARRAAPAILRHLRSNGAPDARPIGTIVAGAGVTVPEHGVTFAEYGGTS